MAQNGTATFSDPAEYGASIGGARVNITVTGGGDFNARLTWLNLDHVFLLHGRENISRIGFFSLSPKQAFVSFPTNAGSLLTYGGSVLQFGDLVFHSRGERTHQRTDGKSEWGIISFSHEQFSASTAALTGTKIMSPQQGRVLRPSRGEGKSLFAAPFKSLPPCRNETGIDCESRSCTCARARIAAGACQLLDGRRCRKPFEAESA